MSRRVGTVARGIRAPIVRTGDDLVSIVVDALCESTNVEGFKLKKRDVVGVTESLLARAQGNYASIEAIAEDVAEKFPADIALLFPILSRNRFVPILKALALSGKKITVILSYPCDEVGNHLMDVAKLEDTDINRHKDVLTEADYRAIFGYDFKHPFTGLDYIELYKSIAQDSNIEIYFANDCRAALRFSQDVLVANVHDRFALKNTLLKAGARIALGLDDLLTQPLAGSGFNPEFGLLGCNQASDSSVKLFPRDSQDFVQQLQQQLLKACGESLEVLVYGDGAFKDPQGKIWELADPLVSPGYTSGLEGTPNEIKIKYMIDNELAELGSDEVDEALRKKIRDKAADLTGELSSNGTTPRRLTDLIGTICDLISGSGDKGTPIVLVQGYFDNFASL